MSITKFKFNRDEDIEFILVLVSILIVIIFFLIERNALFKFILLGVVIILSIYAITDILDMVDQREAYTQLVRVKSLRKSLLILNAKISLWAISVLLILYSFFLLIFYTEFITYPEIVGFLTPLSQIMLGIGVLLTLAGIFIQIPYKELGEKEQSEFTKSLNPLRIVEIIGIGIMIAGFFILTFTFIPLYPEIYLTIYYVSLILGLVLLMINEMMEKSRKNYILLILGIGVAIFGSIFRRNLLQLCLVEGLEEISFLTIVDIVQRLSLFAFVTLTMYYLMANFEDREQTKANVKDFVIISFFIWIVALSQLLLFSVIV